MGTIFLISGTTWEWIIFLLFVIAILAVTAAEAIWLFRNQGATFGRSLGFTFVSNLVGFAVGGTVVFFIMLILLMMTFDKKLSNMLGGEATMVVLAIGLFTVVPLFLFLSKRLFLTAFRLRQGKAAWIYSLVSTLMVIIVGVGLPTVAAYVITKGGSAK